MDQITVTPEPDAKKPTWPERAETLRKQYPTALDGRWFEAMRDENLMGTILRDVLRLGETPGRTGARTNPPADHMETALRELFGTDYAMEPFAVALVALCAHHNLDPLKLAARAGLSVPVVERLAAGQRPTSAQMESVAKVFGKSPFFWAEYRLEVVLGAVTHYYTERPEATVGIVRKVRGAAKT